MSWCQAHCRAPTQAVSIFVSFVELYKNVAYDLLLNDNKHVHPSFFLELQICLVETCNRMCLLVLPDSASW